MLQQRKYLIRVRCPPRTLQEFYRFLMCRVKPKENDHSKIKDPPTHMMQSLDRTCDILDNVTYTLDAHIAIPQVLKRECGLAYKNGQKIQMRFRGLLSSPYFSWLRIILLSRGNNSSLYSCCLTNQPRWFAVHMH
jgi:hypothetical protein